MKSERIAVKISADADAAYQLLSPERHRTLVAPEDDMWATFADVATPHSLSHGTQLMGRFSIDEDNQLHGFYLRDEYEAMGNELLLRVVNEMGISAAMASSVDPQFLSLSLTVGGTANPVALMYHHSAPPESNEIVEVRLATIADHSAAVAFDQDATGSRDAFLSPYLADRIDLHELYLVETSGRIAAIGECRVDNRAPGNAHVGLVVDPELRGQGLGCRLMNTLTAICADHGLTPRCSTDPANGAAQRVIHRAGFRNRHTVFRVVMNPERFGGRGDTGEVGSLR